MNLQAVVVLGCLSFGIVLGVAITLAHKNNRSTVILLVLMGLLASSLKVWIIQQMPQWQDLNSDSILYDLNAQALTVHWMNIPVWVADYGLRGFQKLVTAGVYEPLWTPDQMIAYSRVLGSHEWLYTAYIAIWYYFSAATQEIVIASNSIWAAILPAATFGVAQALGASRRVAFVAAGLVLIDPSIGVNASSLLKDTLAAFSVMTVLWAVLSYIREGGRAKLLVAVLALSMLGGVRFVAFLGLILAGVVICALLYFKNRRPQSFSILSILICAWLLQGLHSSIPDFRIISPLKILTAPVTKFNHGIGVLKSSDGDASADRSTQGWKKSISHNPVLALARSLFRTIFAPYPWVAIDPGLNWRSFTELYLPGMLLWIFYLPGIIFAISLGIRKYDPVLWLILLFLASQFFAYTIWLGEWSTRQRVYALPSFFALAAIGWVQIFEYVKRKILVL